MKQIFLLGPAPGGLQRISATSGCAAIPGIPRWHQLRAWVPWDHYGITGSPFLLRQRIGRTCRQFFRHYSLRLALLIFCDPWQRWLQLQEEMLPWTLANVLQVTSEPLHHSRCSDSDFRSLQNAKRCPTN